MKVLVFLSALLVGVLSEQARFDQYKVHRLVPQNEEQLEALRVLQKDNELNFWTELGSIGRPVDVMVPPHKRPDFADFVKRNGMQEELFIENVQDLIDEEQSVMTRAKAMDWTSYHNLEDIYEWLDNVTKTYKNVQKIVVGKTYEKRDIYALEITFGANFRTVFIESGIHAREWITAASTTWVINELLKTPKDSVWRKYNYIYVPFFNPDGYAYSWTNNRMWRKTRTPYKSGSRACYGADPNRNYPFQWRGPGTSNDPCSEIYCGPKPLSEVETKTISEYLTANAKNKKIDAYLAFHSYSQLIMYPWDYTSIPPPPSKFWQKIGDAAAADMKAATNEIYKVGGGGVLMDATAGTSFDWFYSTFNSTSLMYLWELRDKGRYGFLLPPQNIIPTGKEVFAAIQRMLIELNKIPKDFN